ncbi:MAG TPA: glycoside hydrolase/phage tail family protein [Devosia sp.]|jgi:hypothetical protein|uniref:baseplate multidomain protein megatron n=1 Tax=Devosia sp. TaxID=1871048 RepID=UPI002F94F8F3
MATLALSVAGQFVGGLVGGPFGATVGRALGALAGSAVDGLLFGEQRAPAAAPDIRLQGSSEGGAVPRLYGWSRLSGNIIWARELELLGAENVGAKGMSEPGEEVVGASFAVAFCEGEVSHLGRIWADGQLLDTKGLTLRFYRGTQDQLPDGLIEATQGEAPAYRGLCYLVVEQLPLNRFGNRIPHLSAELCRVVGDLEPDIRAVTMIPGATEFGYDPVPRLRLLAPGETAGENTHVSAHVSDWTYSVDELTALCPKLEHVALVIAWFGDDLRCGHCEISPRVEAAAREVAGTEWRVAGLGRSDVPVVSQHEGSPAYGGTPSDGSVLAAIADLKARGLKVTLYPMVMMDVPAGNALPDPYGGERQAPYPWRGRITCHPAPGQLGSPDQSAAAAMEVEQFATRYRQMVLHYAGLAQEAGGVDMLVIGSEMVGLTTVRGAGNSFPFVAALVELAAEVRSVVGAGTKLIYAADWTEYSGYQQESEKFFHLDPLWASPAIDAVGIDNYMPLADWREGDGHADAGTSAAGYDLDYLMGNIAGGEGHDWFYASPADRLAQQRTPITDGAHGEPWIWRFKDLRNWWSHAHHDRPGGVRQAEPTAWIPGSKPIFFTELGCGAVDKGANQPNIFGDQKSAEGGRPYFSRGTPDPLIQRQVLRAHQRFWRDPANNPPGMVDVSHIYHWTWDARPYPAFPAQTDVWADGVNHRRGHWLTGRLGAVSSGELAERVAADHGVTLRAEPAQPFVTGYVLSGPTTAREALEPLLQATALRLRSRSDGLQLAAPGRQADMVIDADMLVRGDEPVLTQRRGDPAEAPGRLALTYQDRERDYLNAAATAMMAGDGPLVAESTALTMDGAAARQAAERMLDQRVASRQTVDLALPSSALALEPGDVVRVAGAAGGPFEVTQIRDGLARRVTGQTVPAALAVSANVDRPFQASAPIVARAVPLVIVAHLSGLPADPARSRLVIGAYAKPWPGVVDIADDETGARLTQLTRTASLGTLLAPLRPGPTAVWDLANTIELELRSGHLSSAAPGAVLAGVNRLAVENDAGEWEVVAFAEAELVASGRYRLSRLLRGVDGTAPTMALASATRRVMVLDGRTVTLPVEPQWLVEARRLRIYGGPADTDGTGLTLVPGSAPALPLPPVHLRARSVGSEIVFAWTRCSRSDADGWGVAAPPLDYQPERYEIAILNGGMQVRWLQTDGPEVVYGAGEQVADFGASPTSFVYSVAQLSARLGSGHTAWGEFHGQKPL